MASVGPMEIRDYTALVNKCKLVEEDNKKLMVARPTRDDFRKKLAPQDSGLSPHVNETKISKLVIARVSSRRSCL